MAHDDSAAELLFRITHQELTQDLSMQLTALEEAAVLEEVASHANKKAVERHFGDSVDDVATAVAASRAADVLVIMCTTTSATSRSTERCVSIDR